MKTYNLTSAAAFLNISRQTLYRLAEKDLPPDEHSPAGKRIWHHRSLVKYRYAGARTGVAAQFTSSTYQGIACSDDAVTALQGLQVRNTFIASPSYVLALGEVMTALAEMKPNCVVLPQKALKDDMGTAVMNACLASGIGVFFVPDQQ